MAWRSRSRGPPNVLRMRGALALGILLSAGCTLAVDPAAARPPTYCVPTQAGLQEVTGTPAGPYFVSHPAASGERVATVIFLPGGSGLRRNAQRIWDSFLVGAKSVDLFRVVIPYWPDLEMLEDFRRTLRIVDEINACYGGDPAQVHLAGFSNGGHAAFDLMVERPERFATLLGAPGEFDPRTSAADLARLRGKAVFNGVGELDDEFWHKGVRDAHEALIAAGVDSVYVEFKGQGHGAREGFPRDLLLDFWLRHSTSRR